MQCCSSINSALMLSHRFEPHYSLVGLSMHSNLGGSNFAFTKFYGSAGVCSISLPKLESLAKPF